MIVTARTIASAEAAIASAWHGEKMAREKRLQPLAQYQKNLRKPDPDKGAGELRGMIARMAAKQGGLHGAS